jgi:hypothetical protein
MEGLTPPLCRPSKGSTLKYNGEDELLLNGLIQPNCLILEMLLPLSISVGLLIQVRQEGLLVSSCLIRNQRSYFCRNRNQLLLHNVLE